MISTVLLIGGCAAEAMKRGLTSAPAARGRYRFVDLPVHLTSFADPATQALIASASHIFAQQVGGTDWALIEAKANPTCKVWPFPDVALRCLWPFDANYYRADDVAEKMPVKQIRHFDGMLARLRKIEPDKKKRMARYRDLDFPMAGLIERTQAAQLRLLQGMDENTDCGFGDFISRHFRTTQLFYNAAHPSAALFQQFCEYCWVKLDLPGSAGKLTGIDSWRDWSVPVHPAIARRLGVTWADERTRYSYRTLGDVTWDEWVEQYIEMFG